jgi:glutamate-1-semialdehyde 2,1-aminomutase
MAGAQQAVTTNSRVPKSLELYEKAKTLIPKATQLLSRHPFMNAYGVSPIYIDRAKGCRFWDVDGHEYIDTTCGTGIIGIGYCIDEIDDAAREQLAKGLASPINSPLELELAELLVEAIPSAEMVRYAKGGGEADCMAIRIARGYTGKDKIALCGYHGWHDWYLAANLETEDALDSHVRPVPVTGVPQALKGTAIPFDYNDLESLRSVLESNRGEMAAIILEPCRTFTPAPGFLEGVRDLADEHEAVLIFDEVVTGFRLARGGAQEYFGVTPDVTVLGKAVANGYSLAAVVGKREVMSIVDDMFMSSSNWSEAVSLAAGIAIQKFMVRHNFVDRVWEMGEYYQEGLRRICSDIGLTINFNGMPPVFGFNFGVADSRPVDTLLMQEFAKRGVHGGTFTSIMYALEKSDHDEVLAAFKDIAPILKEGIENNKVADLLEVPVAESVFKRRMV